MYDRQISTTVCSRCAHVIVPEGSRKYWFYWLCAAKKWPAEFNPVTGQNDKYPPYRYCKDHNGGDCPNYEPGPNQLNPRATEDGEIVDV